MPDGNPQPRALSLSMFSPSVSSRRFARAGSPEFGFKVASQVDLVRASYADSSSALFRASSNAVGEVATLSKLRQRGPEISRSVANLNASKNQVPRRETARRIFLSGRTRRTSCARSRFRRPLLLSDRFGTAQIPGSRVLDREGWQFTSGSIGAGEARTTAAEAARVREERVV